MRYAVLRFMIICIVFTGTTGLFAQDSENVEHIGSFYNSWGYTSHVVVDGDYAYLATGFSGLQIVDISDPENPIIVGHWDDNPSHCNFVSVQNGKAYIINSDGNLQIVNVSDPSHPFLVGHYENEFFIVGSAVHGDYVYLSGFVVRGGGEGVGVRGPSEFRIIDINNSAEPDLVGGNFNFSFDYRKIVISEDGDYAFAFLRAAISIKDIRNPEHPEGLGYLRIEGSPTDLFLRGDFAYVTSTGGVFSVVNIRDLEDPIIEGSIEIQGWIGSVYVEDDYAYVFDGRDNVFYVIDISDHENPRITGSYVNLQLARGIVVREDNAYIAGGYDGLSILDVSEHNDIHEAGSIDIVGCATGLAVLDDYVYIADGFDGLSMFDISDPENPQEAGSLATLGSASDIDVQGDYAYGIVNRSMRVFNVSEPDNIVQVSSVRTYRSPTKVIVQQDYAYVNGYAFQVIDIRRPEHPGEITELYLQAAGFTINEDYAFVANWVGNCLYVVDIQDPPNPEVIHTFEIAGSDSIKDIAVQGGYIYFSNTEMKCGLSILDISDPENLFEVNQPDTAHYPPLDRIQVIDNLVYITSGSNGLRIVVVSNPENPVNVGFYNTPGYARDIAVLEDGLIYIADETNVGIYRFTDPAGVGDSFILHPSSFIFFSPYPNPFNSTTTISYGLPHPGKVSLQLYDVKGQQISTLFEGNRQAGIYSTNLAGKDLASGLYFVRLEGAGQVFTRKVMLVR